MDDVSPFEPTVLGAMRKYWWLVILIVVAITALAIVYAFFSPVSYYYELTLGASRFQQTG